MTIYKITKQERELCNKFANECVDTNIDAYMKRRQFNREKIIHDIETGKLAEWAVYKHLKSLKWACTAPDVEIYAVKDKSFDADLRARDKKKNDYHVHVKSQHAKQAKRYGLSWTFQKWDKLITQPTKKDLLVLCIVDDEQIEVVHVLKAEKAKGIYGEPKLRHLTTKKVLYDQDIKTLLAETN